jgi:hypothetical protein
MNSIFFYQMECQFKEKKNGFYIDCIWTNDLHSTICLRSCWSLLDQPQADMFCIQTFKLCFRIPSHEWKTHLPCKSLTTLS